jgi:hypothetical protein
MSEIFVPGPLSGRNYGFKIAGDQPTADERQRIDAILRQQEAGFAQQYEARFGQNLLPSRGVGAQIGEFFRGIPRGAGGLFETAALGLSTPFGEETELKLREGIRGIGMNLQDRYAPPIGREDTVGGRLGEAVGSMGAIAGSGLAAGLVGGPIAGFGVGAGLGAAAGAGEASERARAFGATQEERNLATRLGLIPGALEVVPLARLSRVLERGGLRERLTRALIAGGEEGLQEAASSIAQNLIEQGVYNPEQGTFEGTGEDLGYGAGAGALIQAISDLIIPGRLRRRVGEGTSPPEAGPEATPPAPPPVVDPAAFQQQLDLGLPDPVDPLRPGFVAGQDQGELFAPSAEREATPTTEAETTPPAQPGATRTPNAQLANLLQELEIPRGARVSQLVRNGTINDMLGFREALTRFAAATTPERAARVNQWLQTSREQPAAETETAAQPDTDVRNTTLGPEVQADVAATQETQDAQATPSGPVGADPAADRAGPEGGIAELGAREGAVDTDTAGAQPPVGDAVGEPVLGARAPDAPEGAQPTALTPRPRFDPDRFAESVRDASERGYMAPPDTLLEQSDIDSRVAMARGRTDPETPALSPEVNLTPGQVTGAGPQVIPSPVLREPPTSSEAATAAIEPVPTTPEAMQRVLDEIGIGERTGVGRAVRQAARGETELTPEGFLQALGNAKFKKPEVRRKRDEWLSGARERLRNAPADPAVDTVVAQIEELRAASTVRAKIGDWFAANASPALKTGELITPPTDRDSVPLSAKDMRAILGLLESSRAFPKSKELSPEKAAARYFGRASDPGVALMIMAHDAAHGRVAMRPAAENKAAGIKPVDIIPQTFTKESILGGKRLPVNEFEAADVALLENLGWGTGIAAERWVMANLSPDGIAKFISARDGRSRADSPGYIVVSYSNRAERRDAAKGLRSDGRTVDQMTDKELEARKEALAADQAATEEKARQFKGISPDGWAQLSPQLRQEHVADYFDLLDSSRSDPVTRLPDAPVGPIAQEPVRRAVPRREKTPAQQMIEEIEALQEQMQGPQELDFGSFAGQTTWPSDAHPRVGALIAAGSFGDAVRLLAATAPNADIRALAAKLASRVANVRSQIVPAETMNRIRAAMSPETPTLGVETPSGVYVHPMSPEAIAAMRREGHEDAASIVEEFGGQILFNADTPLAPELVMHEASHAAGDAILTNKSHPLTRQLDKLRTELLKFMPATHYGLSNVREFFAEGMTNPAFRQALSSVTAEGRPRSAWQQFKDIVRNWLRGVMGRQPIKPDTPLTALDRALDAIMASNPNEMQAGDVLNASFAPGGASQALRDAFDRTRVPTKADLANTRRVLQDARIPSSWKGALMRLAMPLDYMADAATKYMPSARRVFDLVMQQQADIQKGASRVMETTEQTAKILGKYRQNQSVIDKFNQVLFEATRLQIDPRKPESAYKGYSFQYNVLDKDGNITRRVESQRYNSELERNRALQAYNRALSPELRENKIARAKRGFDESAETLQEYRRIKGLYDTLPSDVKPEVTRMFSLQPEVGKELVDAIRSRLEALLPQQRNLQDKVFGMIYDKMLAGQLLDPYVALRRQGQFWLSYSAVDPMSVTTDPVTGQVDYSNAQVEQFKHSFQTEAQRQAAIRALQQLPPEQQVNNIDAYENVGSRNARPNVPLEFVAGVLDAIDTSDTLGQLVDPATGQQGAVKQQVIQLMFDTLPESSFMNSFKRREGIRGFIGDTTPITENLTAGDTVKNLRESAMRIARQATDLKYGAQFAAARKALTDEAKEFQTSNPRNLSSAELGRERAEAKQYYEMLTEYTTVPFRQRSGWSRSLTGGAYMLTLGANVSTALITMSQVPLFVAPFLSGKHGMGRTISAIGLANRLLAGSGKERTIERIGADGKIEQVRVPVRIWDFSLDNYDVSDPSNAYLGTLQRVAKDNGVFNRSLMQDELLGEQPTLWQKIAGYSGIMQHHAERYSRETALMASYHLSLQDAMGQQSIPLDQFVQSLKDGTLQPTEAQQLAAAKEAVDVSEKTNGPIYAAAGPLQSQSDLGAIFYLFKRHPLSMLNLIYQTATRANPFGTNDPADRKIAQRQFAGMLGMLGLMSGAMGLPMMQQVGWLYDLLFADDDEPDFESAMRMGLGEAGTFGLIDYLTGMKVSERIGLGGAIYRPGFASEKLPVPYQILEGVGGPVLGLGLKYLDRAPKLLAEGEYQRFAEAVLPSALANAARAYRFGDGGIRTMRGDPIVDDIGPFHLAAQSMGFMPTVYAQRLAMNSLGTKIDNAINTNRSKLLQKRNKALRDGDFDTVRRVDGEIQEFNQRHPRNPITQKTIRDSNRAFNDRSARTNYGLAVAPRNQAYIDELTSRWGAPTAF